MKITKAPESLVFRNYDLNIFLAGTIDNGNSENWQELVEAHLSNNEQAILDANDNECSGIHIFNPRRDNWDPNAGDGEVQRQIKWESEALKKSDIIIMNFLSGSSSPITLLELGLYADKEKLVVICNEGYYRYTNVWMTCEKFNIPVYGNLEEMFNELTNNTNG